MDPEIEAVCSHLSIFSLNFPRIHVYISSLGDLFHTQKLEEIEREEELREKAGIYDPESLRDPDAGDDNLRQIRTLAETFATILISLSDYQTLSDL